MQKPLAIQKYFGRTDRRTDGPTDGTTDTARCRVACPRLIKRTSPTRQRCVLIVSLCGVNFALIAGDCVYRSFDSLHDLTVAKNNRTSPTGQRCVLTVSMREVNFALNARDTWRDRCMNRQTARISDITVKGYSQDTCIVRLIHCTISPWPKTTEKCDFQRGVTDRRTDGPTD